MTQTNTEEIAYWNSAGGRRWAARADATERFFAPLTGALMERAAVRTGERVLDIGCGCGGTTVGLGSAVGASGTVLGVDISRPMLAVANARGAAVANVRFIEADASVHQFDERTVDLAFSRFGVMFFADPVAAFRNIHRAVAGGRLTFMCWQEQSANPWQTVPRKAVEGLVPPGKERSSRFIFADPDRTRGLLGEAGFRDVAIERFDTALVFGHEPAEAAEVLAAFGSVGNLLESLEPAQRKTAVAAIEAALRDAVTPAGVALRAGTWIVTAQA